MKKSLLLFASLACAMAFSMAQAVECEPVSLKVEAYPVAVLDGKTIKMAPKAEAQLAVRAERLADGRIALKAAEPLPYQLSGVRYTDNDALAKALKENVAAEQACRSSPSKASS